MGQTYGRESVRQAGVTSETDERADQARFYKEQVEKLGIEPTSPRSIGLANGIEENTVYELPERLWGREVKQAAKAAKDAGCNFKAVLGTMQLKNGHNVDAFFDEATRTVVVRADGLVRNAEQLGLHEIYHKLAAEDSSLNQTIRARIRSRMDAAAYEQALREYVLATRSIYDLADNEGEDLAEEEMLADAYAGMNRFKDADATKYTKTVRQSVQERTNRQTEKATENKTGPTSQKYSFAGENAETANVATLDEAKDMEQRGENNETIRKETGWFKGRDGKWRFELDDSGMKITKEYLLLTDGEYKLKDIISHDALFSAYPQIGETKVVVGFLNTTQKGIAGQYNSKTDTLQLNRAIYLPDSSLMDLIVHEVQHKIQNIEGFARGSSPAYWKQKGIGEDEYNKFKDATQNEFDKLTRKLSKEERNDLRRYFELDKALDEVMSRIDFKDIDGASKLLEQADEIEKDHDALYKKLYGEEWFEKAADLKNQLEVSDDLYMVFYKNTAGEIEARDVTSRRMMTHEERAANAPDLGNEYTVFAEGDERETGYFAMSAEEIADKIKEDDGMMLSAEEEEAKVLSAEKDNFKEKQFEVIQNSNPADDDYHTWIRSAEEIKTLQETVENPEWDYDEYDPDWTRDDAKEAIESGKVTVYSSYPIENGTFVSPSKMEAESYSGNGKIYSKTVKTNNVAWIDPTQGQYAEVNDIRYSESEEAQEQKQEKLPRYAKQEAEKIRYDMMREIGADIFRDMGPVKAAIDDMAREAFQSGAISEETRKAALDAMLDNAVRFDTEMYDNYKEVRDFLRKKKIRVPEDVKAGIPDFADFRKRNFGRINLSETTGMGIDQAYMELRELAPELFPEDTINLQDQLERMASVREELQQGKESEIDTSDEDFMNFVEERFKVLADGMESEIRTQKRNEEQQTDEKRRAEKARLAREGFDGRRAEAASILNTLADRTEVGELDVGDIEPAWRIKNTREMQDIYRQYAANTPEERRLDEGLYWYMKQKVANGDIAQRKQAISTLQAAQNAQDFTRDGFTGTKALEKIGVKIARSVTGYENTEQMIARDKAAKQTARMIRKAENDLNATPREKYLAEGIASGVMTTKDIRSTEDRSKIIELADYYLAGWSAGTDMVQQRKKDIRDNLQDVMESLFEEFKDNDRVAKQAALILNYNHMDRNAIRIFGDDLGGRINKIIFDPIIDNGAEMTRWRNQQMDDVREFVGKDGKKSGLTDAESALVQQVLEGASVAELVASDEMAMNIRAAADEINEGKDPADAAIAWGLGREQQQLAKKYAGWTQTVEALKDADEVKINNAVKAYREKFNSFYDAINDFLTAHGFATIGFIKNYAPHMQTEQDQTLLTKALQAMGISTEVTELPTSIAGLTGDYKPNKSWNPYFLSRTTDITNFDIQAAYQSYVEYMANVLFHTDDIMTMRSMVKYFRTRFAPEEIRNEIDRIQSLRNADHDAKREFLRDTGRLSMDTFPTAEQIDEALNKALEDLLEDEKNKSLFGNYVSNLEEYANQLANKQSMGDRGFEQKVGRKGLNAGRKLIYTFQKSQVAANLSSALNQSAQLANIIGDKGVVQTARAVADIMSGKCKKENFRYLSDYLTAKKGVDFLVTDKKEMIISKLFAPAEFADGLMSTIAVRAAYNEALKKGMNAKEAMRYADKYGRRVMGDRTKEGRPVAFASKSPLWQMVNVFQIEALNTWQHLAQDTLGSDFREIERTNGRKAAARAVAGVLVKTILSAFILNRLGEELYGGTPAPFDFLGLSANFIASGYGLDTNEWIRTVIDNAMEKLTGERIFDTDEIDEEFEFWTGAEDLGYNITNDIPFVRNVAGLLGWGDETLPIPNVGEWFGDVKKDLQDGMTWQDAGEDAFDLITMLAPGGRQITKTVKGIKALEKGGDYTASGKLKYTIDSSDPLTFIKAIAFGANSLNEAREYWAAGGKYLSDSQTEKFNQLREEGYDREMVYDLIQDMKKVNAEDGLTSAERGAAIRNLFSQLDVPDDNKVELYNRLNFDEEDTKPEKLTAMRETGMSWDQIEQSYNKYQELYNEDELDKTQKATEMSMFFDKLGLKADQKEAAKDGFKFYSMVPAEAGKYEKLTETGMDEDAAYEMTHLLSGLEPMEGKNQVTDTQKYEAILKSDFGTENKELGLRTVINAKTVDKIDVLSNFGVSCEVYAKFKVKWEEKYPGESVSQEKAEAIINSMGLSNNAQKAALFQLVAHPGKKKDGSISNPYSEASGLKAWELIDDMPD